MTPQKTIGQYVKEIRPAFTGEEYGTADFEWFGLNVLFQYQPVNGFTPDSPMPDPANLICYCTQGNNEGYIVTLELRTSTGPDTACTALIVGKCFDREYAWTATRQLAELCGIMGYTPAPKELDPAPRDYNDAEGVQTMRDLA